MLPSVLHSTSLLHTSTHPRPPAIGRIWTHRWNMGLTMKGSHGRTPGRDQTLAVCSLFWIVWVESSQPYCPENLDCKSVEGCLCFLSADRERKCYSCGVVILGRPLHGLCLTSPVICNLAFNLKMVLGHSKWCCNLGFLVVLGTAAWKCPLAQALSRSVKLSMMGADTNWLLTCSLRHQSDS